MLIVDGFLHEYVVAALLFLHLHWSVVKLQQCVIFDVTSAGNYRMALSFFLSVGKVFLC